MIKTVNILKIALVMLMCTLMLSLTACGKAITVSVSDMGETKEIEVTTGMTVEEALESASITLGEKDETTPAKDKKIAEDTKEIVIKRYAKVTVVKGDKSETVELVGGTVDQAISKAGFAVAKGETSDVKGDTFLKDGMTINILKKVTVSLTADGKTTQVDTVAKTVEEFLKEQAITLDEDDELSVKLTDAVTEGMTIVVKRVEYKEETRTEKIAFETQEKYSDSLAEGTSEVTQEGVEGSKEVTYKVKYVDSKEESKEVISEKITKEPTNKIVTYGTKSSGNSSGGSEGGGSSDGGRTVVSKQPVYDCDGSGHGYYIITYSDGSVEYEEF